VLHNFAILDGACTPDQAERPEDLIASSPRVNFQFNDQTPGEIRNFGAGETGPLHVPEYFIPYRRASLMDLGDTWAPRPLWGDIALNVLAFVPLGVLLSFFLGKAFHPVKVVILVVLAGFGLSLCIEMLQVYLPRRWSTFMDVATNSLGALVGSMSWFLGVGRFLRTKLSRPTGSPAETQGDFHQ
jgi:glycopeptide antibiotics resistance protein